MPLTAPRARGAPPREMQVRALMDDAQHGVLLLDLPLHRLDRRREIVTGKAVREIEVEAWVVIP